MSTLIYSFITNNDVILHKWKKIRNFMRRIKLKKTATSHQEYKYLREEGQHSCCAYLLIQNLFDYEKEV